MQASGRFDVLVVGAGPCGLSTAAALQRAGFRYLVVDKGCLVDSLTRFPTHMQFFSTSEKLSIAGIPFVTPRPNPNRVEALEYYRQVADALDLSIRLYEEVVDVEKTSAGFRVVTRSVLADPGSEAKRGRKRVWETDALVLATGYFDHPRRLDVPGEHLPHVSHYYREAHPYFRQKVVVIGGQNSAVEAALDLYRAGAEVTLIHRGDDLSPRVKPWVLPLIRMRLQKGDIRAYFRSRVVEIRSDRIFVESVDPEKRTRDPEEIAADFVFAMTGYVPDHTLGRGLGMQVDPQTGIPSHDPETMETNIPNLYLAGVTAAGFDANRIFIENGRFHGPRIAVALLRKQGLGEAEARDRVRVAVPKGARSGEDGIVEF